MSVEKLACRLVDLGLDLLRSVGEVDRRRHVTAAHLALRSVQRRDERREHQRRLRKSQPRRNVARHPEVRVLVDCARDQARNVDAAAEYLHNVYVI